MYLDYHKKADKYWCVDCEANSLQPTQFWCGVAVNLGTNEELIFDTEAMYDGRFKRFIEDRSTIIVGQNFISYDSYWLRQNKIADVSIDRIVDSLTLSYLYHPHLPGGHSLEAYGERFGLPKLGHEDWSRYSDEMLQRCRRDVQINILMYKGLVERMNKIGYSELSCSIESRIRNVIDKQERRGFYFNKDNAGKLVRHLESELASLSDPIQKLFPPTLEPVKDYAYRKKKDGSEFASFLRHQEEYDAIKFNETGSEYTTYSYKDFNIGSPDQRVQKLLSLGWIPTVFTPAGNPKVDEDALKEFAEQCGDERIGLIADWVVRSSRKSTVESWLKCVQEDSRIHGQVFSCGAASRRMRHNKPNTANAPRVTTLYGKECRELWTTEDTNKRKLVGYDASGLEMRMFGHELGGGKAADIYINGKPHVLNAESMNKYLNSEVTKDHSKKSFFSMLYGAYDARLGNDYNNGGAQVGAKIRNALLKATPGLEKATRRAQDEWNHNGGLLRTIDGGYVRCPTAHSALNFKLQPNGAIAMKLTTIKLDDWITKNGVDSWKVADVHDEGQQDTEISICKEVGEKAVSCIKEAGEELGFCVPLSGEYTVGDNWAMSH